MSEQSTEMVSMSDIARLVGQSRSTVGNWKARNPDFPTEHGRTARGPLYDRAEVEQWLDARSAGIDFQKHEKFRWHLVAPYSQGMTFEQQLHAMLLILICLLESDPMDARRVWVADSEDGREDNMNVTRVRLFRALLGQIGISADDVVIDPDWFEEAMDTAYLAEVPGDRFLAYELLDQASRITTRPAFQAPMEALRHLMVGLCDPEGSLLVATPALGQVVVDAARAVEAAGRKCAITADVSDQTVEEIVELALRAAGYQANLRPGNGINQITDPNERFDRILAAPDWSERFVTETTRRADPRWMLMTPEDGEGVEAWIQHCLYYLSEGGRAVVLVPSSFLFQSGRTGQFRQGLVAQGWIEAVFSLPPDIGPDKKIAYSVLVLTRRPIAQSAHPLNVLLVDASGNGGSRRNPPLAVEATVRWIDAYRGWKELGVVSHPCVAVDGHQIADRNFILSPDLYLDLTERPVDLVQMLRERESVVARLEHQLDLVARADEALKEVFQWEL